VAEHDLGRLLTAGSPAMCWPDLATITYWCPGSVATTLSQFCQRSPNDEEHLDPELRRTLEVGS
jgi:hypothetical protein